MRNRTASAAAACLSGCLLAAGLSGCCTHHSCCHEAAAEAEPPTASTQPVPGALEYPRFYPVPTRPVFLPQGIESPSAELQPVPAESPALSTAPNDGWHPPSK